LDGWNYALFSIETALNVAFIPVFFVFGYICIAQKNLHVNFRATLFFAGMGCLVGVVHRLLIVSARVCCIARRDTSLVGDLLIFQSFGQYLYIFGSLFVVIERAIASSFSRSYSRHCTGFAFAVMFCGMIMLLTLLHFAISALRLTNYFDLYFTLMQIAVAILNLVALIVILRINTSTYRKRHESMMQLADRYHLDENIRTGRYFIPVALNDFICKVIFAGLCSYSIFFTDIPLGHDSTHLSHAYDVMFACQRMFFGLALTLRSEKFDNLMRRKKRAIRVLDSQAGMNHFDGLKKLWS
uniref:G protein-coupled receptor n=1 Tax=Haemonchus contortus TaxID=6289 RepID=A0A7I4Y2R2_HAECO